jgi:hypothetical protein
VIAQPGRMEASRRRAFEGRGWLGLEAIGTLDQVLCTAAKASPASRHQSSIAAVIQRVSSWCTGCSLDGHELLGVDVLGRHAEAFEPGDRGGQHGRRPAQKDIGAAQIWGEVTFE